MPQNYYPALPVVPYFNGSIPQSDAVAYLKASGTPKTTQQSALALILNESGNLNKVINGTNAAGFQSDAGKWNSKWDSVIIATTNLTDSTGAYRGFLVFNKWQSCFDMVLYYVEQRGFGVGTPEEMATKYYQNWVYGDSAYTPTTGEISGFISLLRKAANMLNGTPDTAPVSLVKYSDTDATTNGMVSKIQQVLISKGYLEINTPTGYYGSLTKKSVEAFQGDNRLSVNGICGSDTLGVLGLI